MSLPLIVYPGPASKAESSDFPKVMLRDDALALLPSGGTVAISGFVSGGHPEYLTEGIEELFHSTGKPADLALIYAAGQGDGKARGMNHLAHVGLTRKCIGGHWGLAPALSKLALNEQIEAYNVPQGVISKGFREIASGMPFIYSSVGLETFVDPRVEGGRVNKRTTRDIVHVCEVDGAEYLRYDLPRIDCALLRGTTADRQGNVSTEHEPFNADLLAIAQAAHNCGGKVIVQVSRVVENIVRDNKVNPQHVAVPGMLVDAVVVAPKKYSHQTFRTEFNPAFCPVGEDWRENFRSDITLRLLRKLIAARAVQQLRRGQIINMGIGMPEGVGILASEQDNLGMNIITTVEVGPVGGVSGVGQDFGAMYFPTSAIVQSAQFDFYHGNGLDIAFLGAAQIDRRGNVNVSRYGSTLSGCGGFIDISQNTSNVVFMASFTTGGLDVTLVDGKLVIVHEGRVRKFVNAVEQITFSGIRGVKTKQKVLFVTERALFRLEDEGLVLVEVAPGVDVERDVFAHMDFRPNVAKDFRENPTYYAHYV